MENLRTKTTFINKKFYVRLLENDLVINEMACRLKIDVGYCCKFMLRWYDKLGGSSKLANASRHRFTKGIHKYSAVPYGKIWYEKDLRSK